MQPTGGDKSFGCEGFVATDYLSIIGKAVWDAGAKLKENRLSIYERAREAQENALRDYSQTEAQKQRRKLEKAIRKVESFWGSESRAFLTSRQADGFVKKALYTFARYTFCLAWFLLIFVYPAVAPEALVPQWLLDHPTIFLIWCGLYSAFFVGALFIWARAATQILEGENNKLKRYISSAYILYIPLIFAMALIPFAGVLYNLGNLSQYYNPFGHPFTFLDAYVFLVDTAFRGTLSNVSDLFDIHLQDKLSFKPWDHVGFWGVIALYKILVSFIGIGVVILVGKWVAIHWILKPIAKIAAAYHAWNMRRVHRQYQQYKRWFPFLKGFIEWLERWQDKRIARLTKQTAFLTPIMLNPGRFAERLSSLDEPEVESLMVPKN
jgi:hypothetical protein